MLRTDAEGQTVNTASYGAGSWQYAATDYNDDGQAVREWSTGDIDAIRDGRLGAPDAGTLTVYNTENLDMLAGTVVTDTYSTARFVTLDNGTRAWARPKLHTDYDETAPAGVSPGLPTTQTATVVNPATTNTLDTLSVVKTSYGDAIDGDPEAGWNMGLVGSTTTVIPGGADIVSTTRYDAQGRVISQRQPKSNGSDAGARETIYYTAGSNPVGVCGNKPAWEGAVCQTRYAGTGAGGFALPTTTVTYNDNLLPMTITEAANGGTRTTTNTYTTDGSRLTATAVSVTGVTGSAAVPSVTCGYDAATGMPTTVNPSTGSSITTGYDTWGRARTYTPATGETTTTYYDTVGRVDHVTDSKYTGDVAGTTDRPWVAWSQTALYASYNYIRWRYPNKRITINLLIPINMRTEFLISGRWKFVMNYPNTYGLNFWYCTYY